MKASPWAWFQQYKWRLLLAGMAALLLISPISQVYDQQDNFITPLTAGLFLAIILSTVKTQLAGALLTALTVGWMVIGVLTDGSGLFAGPSLLAPILFLFLLVVIFILLARWLVRARDINAEVLCAAICGYLLLGFLWAGVYAVAEKCRYLLHEPDGFVSTTRSGFSNTDWLYFSYTTLTTTGYGDILPRGSEVRMLAVVEAMVGLFYNTIVIARFVGLYGFRASREKE